MKLFVGDASVLSKEADEACDNIFEACNICTSSGLPVQRRKVLLSHVNEAFSEELHCEVFVICILDFWREV